MTPSEILPFSWGTSDNMETYRLQPFLKMVNKVMDRRELSLTAKAEQLLEIAWEEQNSGHHANP